MRAVATTSGWNSAMTRNHNRKRRARAYKAEHPGVTYPEALRRSKVPSAPTAGVPRLSLQAVLSAAAQGDRQLMDHELDVSLDYGPTAFYVDLGREIEEGPVDVDWVEVDSTTMDYDVSEEYDDGTSVGEVRVTATADWSACVYKPTYYGAPSTVSWDVVDHDWNDHYVRVAGQLTVELVYEFTAIPHDESPAAFVLTGMSALS